MPKKFEHIVKCPLSKRQRFLYDDFMSRAKTMETLESGNLLVSLVMTNRIFVRQDFVLIVFFC
jgi:SNF2 family DNA or RNA helicase